MSVKIPDLNKLIAKEVKILAAEKGYKLTRDGNGVELTKDLGSFISQVCLVVLYRPYFDVEVLGFCFFMSFPQVEKIVEPILSRNDLKGKADPADLIATFSTPSCPRHDLPHKIIINKLDEILPIIEKFKLFFVEDAMPYFEKWKDLSTVHQYLLEVQEDEVLLQTLGIFFHFKWPTIMRLCGNPDCKPYAERYFKEQEGYYKEEPNDIQNIRYYNASKELLEALEKIKPIGEIRYEGR